MAKWDRWDKYLSSKTSNRTHSSGLICVQHKKCQQKNASPCFALKLKAADVWVIAQTLFKCCSKSYRWFHNYVRQVSLLSRFHQSNARKSGELLICFTRHLTRWEPQKEIWNPRVALLRTSYKLIDTLSCNLSWCEFVINDLIAFHWEWLTSVDD